MKRESVVPPKPLVIFFHEVLEGDAPNIVAGTILANPPPDVTKIDDVVFKITSHPNNPQEWHWKYT